MSQRVKRPNRTDDGSVPTKRRKRPTVEEEEAASLAAAAWQPRPFNDLKSIYNRTATEAPAELFRKDLISAMKLPDSEPLASDEYWVIVDQWKQEWERGVQVPVNPDSLPEPCVTVNQCASVIKPHHEFKMPKNKYIRITKDEHFRVEEHVLSPAPAKSEAACSYDLDECDVSWLRLLNGERAAAGLGHVSEEQLERVIERLEVNCWDKIQSLLRNEEGLGIEYDENVICDVCRSPDSEEGNEMVFCDSCNICVHQACYGITRIPEGQWLCGTCALAQRPECVLCPNKGGAMKATRSGQKWAHVSCALWIPEVSIGCVEKMEPITKISSIPQSRWALICVLCRERVGACIQCSVKTCKTAYHVTCAFKHGLEMRAIIEDENADDGVKLRSYCEKHSKTSKKEKSICSGSDDDDSKRKKRKDMTSEEKNQARAARLQEIEAEFDKHVSIKDVTMHVDVDIEALHYIYNYWKLKRKAGHNKPLLPPKSEDVDMLSHKQEQADLEKMKMFVQLRQDLERVRNLCYMVSRREKLSRTFFRMREQTFHKQATVLASFGNSLSTSVVQAVIEANHGPSIYDRLYSHSEAEDHTKDFDVVLARIAGIKSPQCEFTDEKKPELNGLIKDNPYKKMYFNGSSKRRSLYGSSTSAASSSDERNNRVHSSTEDEKSLKKKVGRSYKHNANTKTERRKKRLSITASRVKIESSTEEDVKPAKSRLQQMEYELGISGTDSDELMPIHISKSTESQKKLKAMPCIYSDSDSSDMSAKNDDKSQQNRLRTKAAVKEFSQKPSTSKSSDVKKKTKNKKVVDKKDYVPSDLIVPQRQAAKKASENLKSTSTRIKEQPVPIETDTKTTLQSPKSKPKPTPKKEKHQDVFDIEKEFDKEENMEILSYVPQRQAAKKAAEHIKSGLGKPTQPESVATTELAKSKKEPEQEKAAKLPENKRKSSSNSSTSSSSSSSTDSSSSSSSESEEQQPPPPRPEFMFPLLTSSPRDQIKRTNAKDWPFLDKAAQSAACSSASDCSDSSVNVAKPKIVEREESPRPQSRRSIDSSDRFGDVDVGSRDIVCSDSLETGKGKSNEVAESPPKEITKSDNLFTPIGKENEIESEITNLEREILERKAGRDTSNNKSKSSLDRLLDKKLDFEKVKPRSPEKELVQEINEIKPVKNKSIEDIFAGKLSNVDKKVNVAPVKDKDEKEDDKKPKELPEEIQKICVEEVILTNEFEEKFSPVHVNKDVDLLDFDILDDGFGISKDEEIMKGPLSFSYGNIPLFKEDSKEDSARATLNLVQKLRMKLNKKSSNCDIDDSVTIVCSAKNENENKIDTVPNEKEEKPIEQSQINLEMRVEVTDVTDIIDITSKPVEAKEQDYKYPSCEADVPIENIKSNVHDHSASAQADERWVPPSENYTNLQTYNNNMTQSELIVHHQIIPTHKNHSPIVHDRRISQTPYLEQSSMDCMPSPSPYADIHPQAKWADSQVMPTRRSSSSSATSNTSEQDVNRNSRRNEVEDELLKRPEVMMMNHPNFGVLHQQLPPFPPNSLDPYPPFSEPSQFVSPVSLFPPPNINTQIPFPSPGAAMFPPAFGAAFPTPHSVIPPLPKPVEDNMRYPAACTAAFTSSQHNMALTAAMVNLPPDKEPSPSPAPTTNHIEPSPKSNSSITKKPTRTSARFISQQQNKSPSKSPRQEVASKTSGPGRGRADNKRSTGRGGRGRGRGRGRGKQVSHTDYDFGSTNTIHNKLVGTVYDLDFDDDISNDNMGDLKAMRERRKSADIHDRKSQSPKFASPSNKSRPYNTDLRDLRPPTPIIEESLKVDSPITIVNESQTFPDIVQPVLPGPVDMRTYNSNFESQTYTEANLLGAFASGTAESQVHEDIDEDFEKELHSALTACNKKPDETPVPETANNIKVSLSDSRNQLKVKIKGPIANYTSTVPTLPSSTVAVTSISANAAANNVITNVSMGINSGTSNLRRMRKKELLRQYWTQDMNMDDPASVPGIATAPAAPPVSRTIITIPKAVASMTSIPTRDDYRDYRTGSDDILENKIRKENKSRPGALSRELRQLELSVDEEGMPERRNSNASALSNSFDLSLGNKRRGRPIAKPVTPKLKIKIGGNSIVGGTRADDRKDRIRPPKKRLATIAQPSVEDLKRESMRFRKKVMADFGEEKRKKKDKSSKHKKRKTERVQIISNEGTNPTKLIIRFGRKTDSETSENKRTSCVSANNKGANNLNKQNKNCNKMNAALLTSPVVDLSKDIAPTNGGALALRQVRPNKVSPIKLKLSRCQAGSGYIMKTEEERVKTPSPPPAPPPLALNLPEPAHAPAPLPLNKDCELDDKVYHRMLLICNIRDQ